MFSLTASRSTEEPNGFGNYILRSDVVLSWVQARGGAGLRDLLAGLAGGVTVMTALMLSMLGSYPTVSEVISALGIIAISILAIGAGLLVGEQNTFPGQAAVP